LSFDKETIMNAKFYRITVFVLALALATLACGLMANEPTPSEIPAAAATESNSAEPTTVRTAAVEDIQPTNTAAPTATEEPTSTPEPEIVLGEEYHSNVGGFVFRQLLGYEFEDDNGFVTIQNPDSDPDTGPGIVLFRDNVDQSLTIDDFFAEQLESISTPDIQFSEPTKFLVNGCAARSVDITGSFDGEAVMARFTVVLIRPGQGFVFLGVSPTDQWEQFSPWVQAVEDSIWFSIPQTADPPKAAELSLDEEYRSEKGGYLFSEIPDYSLEETDGYTMLLAPDGDYQIGPSIFLMGGTRGESLTLDALYDEQIQNLNPNDNVTLSPYRDVTVGGVPGRSVDLTGTTNEGLDMTARVTVVLVYPNQMFMMGAISPPDRWEELSGIYEALQESIAFFEPGTDPPATVQPQGDEIHQWAQYAYASSSYDDPDWNASQATGAPDVLADECEDSPLAWASYDSDTVDWLELVYETPVIPTEINIIQTHSPDQIVKVELIDQAGLYHEIYASVPVDHWMECPYTLSIPVDVDYAVGGLKITIDQSVIASPWNEIDAVELVGYPIE